jgi:hypothetical protein
MVTDFSSFLVGLTSLMIGEEGGGVLGRKRGEEGIK